jgi:RNA polymerase sigma-70 factor (ECF subfamily)
MAIVNYIILTDQQLVTLSHEGNSVAFEVLVNRYKDAIYKILLNKTNGNSVDTDDLLQETFIKVFINLDKYDIKYTFGQWVYIIARNTFLDHVRRIGDRRRDLSIDTHPGAYDFVMPIASEATPEESIINSQRAVQLAGHIEKMRPRYRKLIELRFLKECSYEEIAEELQIPLGTVKTQIRRAREQLCELITESDIL